jgi:hypothetical protein
MWFMAVKVEDRTDVLHITGDSDFPLVELKKITIAERPQDGEEDKVLFYNPRHPDSFDDASMQSLLDAILEDGLLEPPIVRVFNPGKPDQIIQLVAGERRTRCLLKAYDENLMIYDKATNEKRPAREVISKIPCNVIYDCSDEKALRIAFTENTKHKGLSSRGHIGYLVCTVPKPLVPKYEDEYSGMIMAMSVAAIIRAQPHIVFPGEPVRHMSALQSIPS